MELKNKTDKKIRIIFMGTPEFAVPGLKALLASPSLEIVGVFTQPDKPVGRKQVLTPPPVKVLALENKVPVFQPEKIRTEVENIKNLAPDLIVVIAYGKIISSEILAIPTYGCLNVHASLLPLYRGAAVLSAPILNGDAKTGVTIMKMDAGLDTGPILQQTEIRLNGRETLEIVHDKLSALGAELLVPTLLDFTAGKIEPQEQDNSRATIVKTLKKEDGRIDWSKPATEIERMIRAYNPWPGTYSEIDGKGLKIISVDSKIIENNNHKPGEIFLTDQGLTIQTGQDSLVILRLQPSGKKIMTANQLLSGHQDIIGKILK